MPAQEIVVRAVGAVHGLAMRETINGTSGIPAFLTDAFAAIGTQGIEPAGPPLTIYHDAEYDPRAIDTEIVIPVTEGVHGPVPTPSGRELTDRSLEAMDVAAVVHTGPYDSLGEVYQAMAAWIEENGYEPAGPPQEIYLSGPNEPGPPVTEIRMPLRRP